MTLSKSFNVHSAEWREIKKILEERRSELVEKLVKLNDEETRGRIKEIDEILLLEKRVVEEEPPPLEY